MILTYEDAKEEDLCLLFAFNKDLIDRYEDVASIDYDQVLAWVKQNLTASLPHFRRVLADGQLAAFYCLSPSDSNWELDSLFVLPPFQRKGIGTEILKKCIQDSSGKLFLYVFRKNTGAVTLYERMGFRVRQTLPTRYILEYPN